MKTALQYFFVWLTKIYFGVWAAFGLFNGISICRSNWAELIHWYDFFLLCLIPIIVSPVLFVFLSIPCGFLLAPLFRLGAKLNGAPFNVGDQVRILVGPHRNRVVKVYEIWDERGQVRVELDELTREKVKDVFSFTQVCRERSA